MPHVFALSLLGVLHLACKVSDASVGHHPAALLLRAGMSHEMLTPICALRGRQRRACCKLLGDAAIPCRCYAACIEDVMWRISGLLLAGAPCGAR